MTKKTFVFINKYKKDWKNWWSDFSHLRNKWVDSKKDFQITIEPYKKLRGEQALKGYWVLIGVITKHLNEVNLENWEPEDISNQFKENIGFTEKVDRMSIWRQRFKKELQEGYILMDYEEGGYYLVNYDKNIYDPIGFRYSTKLRSLKKSKGCTIQDMEELIGEVLRFGADIPDCELKSNDWEEFKLYYGVNE